MTGGQSINKEPSICLDAAELLILNGGRESDELSPDHLLSGVQNGTKVGSKPVPPGAPTGKAT